MNETEIQKSVKALCEAAGRAAPEVALAGDARRNAALLAAAERLISDTPAILTANREDLKNAAQNGIPTVMMDRLRLDERRIAAMANGMRALTHLPDPTAASETWTRPSGITITRRRVPLGVVAIIFESRPNVTADAAALCLKSGNAAVLRGGKEAICSNRAIVESFRAAITPLGFPFATVSLVESTERESATALMHMRGLVDVLIPRGGKGLIRSCVENATVPVIETGAGNCHVYVDREADLQKALRVAVNAKCQRPSVCNAAETLLLHRDIAARFLPEFYRATRAWNLTLRGDERTRAILPEAEAATEEDYLTEYNDYVMAVRVVEDVKEAVEHINRYGTRHSECILTENREAADYFLSRVDAAAVYCNVSTRFTDGEEFGFGAEIGISTQKLHARGPMGLDALTTVKYEVCGDGTVRG